MKTRVFFFALVLTAYFSSFLPNIDAAVFDPLDGNFLGSAIHNELEQNLSNARSFKDKNSPLKIELKENLGTFYAFQHKGAPVIALLGKKQVAIGENVDMPFTALKIDNFVYVYTGKAATLELNDFPVDIKRELEKLWKWERISLLKGHTAIGAASSDLLKQVEELLTAEVNGKNVVALRSGIDDKKKKQSLVDIMVKGKIKRPFNLDFELDEPSFTYKKIQEGKSAIKKYSLTGISQIGKNNYDFAVIDVLGKVPEIFYLQTDKLGLNNLVELSLSFKQLLYPEVAPKNLQPNLADIPLMDIIPRESEKKVNIFVALPNAKHAESGLAGPGMAISGKLRIPVLSKAIKDIAELLMLVNAQKYVADFKIGNLVVPNTNMTLLGAEGHIEDGSLTLTANTFLPGLEKISFKIDRKGEFHPVPSFGKASEFFGHIANTCKAGGDLLLTTAGKAIPYGMEIYKFSENEILNGVDKAFGRKNVVKVAKLGGYTAEKIGVWAKSVGISAKGFGGLLRGHFTKSPILRAASASYPGDIAVVGRQANLSARHIFRWVHSKKNARKAAAIVKKAYHIDQVLLQCKDIYKLNDKQLARVGKKIGYSATQMTHWYHRYRAYSKSKIAEVLAAGKYTQNEVKNSMIAVYKISSKEAEKIAKGAVDIVKDIIPFW